MWKLRKSQRKAKNIYVFFQRLTVRGYDGHVLSDMLDQQISTLAVLSAAGYFQNVNFIIIIIKKKSSPCLLYFLPSQLDIYFFCINTEMFSLSQEKWMYFFLRGGQTALPAELKRTFLTRFGWGEDTVLSRCSSRDSAINIWKNILQRWKRQKAETSIFFSLFLPLPTNFSFLSHSFFLSPPAPPPVGNYL